MQFGAIVALAALVASAAAWPFSNGLPSNMDSSGNQKVVASDGTDVCKDASITGQYDLAAAGSNNEGNKNLVGGSYPATIASGDNFELTTGYHSLHVYIKNTGASSFSTVYAEFVDDTANYANRRQITIATSLAASAAADKVILVQGKYFRIAVAGSGTDGFTLSVDKIRHPLHPISSTGVPEMTLVGTPAVSFGASRASVPGSYSATTIATAIGPLIAVPTSTSRVCRFYYKCSDASSAGSLTYQTSPDGTNYFNEGTIDLQANGVGAVAQFECGNYVKVLAGTAVCDNAAFIIGLEHY
jgi:hypothetical protein